MKPCVCGTKPDMPPTKLGDKYWEAGCANCNRAVAAPTKAEALRMWNAAMTKEDK